MRKDPAAEIYKVAPTRGPRGDVIYKNAEGDTLLRIASYGGATVFWPGEDIGFGASKSFGDDQPLQLRKSTVGKAIKRSLSATAIISALTGAPIVFTTDAENLEHEDADATVLADAVVRAANGIKRVADDPTGARILASRIRAVSFRRAANAGVSLEDGELIITYVPDRDIEGRPSSTAVARFLEDSL